MRDTDKHFSTTLDLCRWVAALVVTVNHLRNMVFVDFANVEQKTVLMKVFYFFTGLGDEAVIVFFVISGFLVGGGALKKLAAGQYDAQEYAIHRISRIYVVFIPALLIGGLLDLVGTAWLGYAHLYPTSQYVTDSFGALTANTMNFPTLLGNLAMVQTWLVPVLGSNSPLWSLANEWWYYCLFWAFLGALSSRTAWVRMAYIVCGTLLAVALPTKILLWFAVWLLGVGLIWADKLPIRIPPAIGILVFFATLVGVHLVRIVKPFGNVEGNTLPFALDFVLGIACGILLLSAKRLRAFKLGSHGLHAGLANFSYTTYLIHLPLTVFVLALGNALFGIRLFQQPTLASVAYAIAVLGLNYLCSYVFARYTEDKTGLVRKQLRVVVGGPVAPAP
jgi:peptidoglycan/LPS O-acetylase OafA/YrhL